ncbi:signal peptidase II [Nocardia cyriacigeorgica]|uniref:signal peptidase II n=1 Tax=Nocardia cyriacigeorgica TaxID=135487 RepID=UPI0013D5BD46|nr:signal peptidase II [Nocardia cyriacigeorgica]MBF6439159.1 signal peptidase II [Nocardia cyriacigeorgica]MBF6455416.1 signal peptidase II [Nocardia cyriacigeorgica]MBF6481760.1 signal peptidase II [Nocardia cyriacigeorgica]MBF6553842.1 signal peptidase II [Nocardia cyriacigeorgica]NEW29463.1 signal peptidase II [Nocardia cyriacigeorgica]
MMVGVSDDRPPEPSTAEQPSEGPARPPQRLRLLLVIAAVLFALDLLTKVIVVATLTPGDPVYLIGDWARLSLVRNPGAAFSMATGMTWLLTLVAAAVVIGVIRIGRTLRSLWWAVGLGMVLGGALGNLVDRLFRSPGPLQGHVVDFVAVGWWPVFNVADSAIVCGAILLVVLTVFGFEPNGTRAGRAEKTTEESENTVNSARSENTENTKNTGAGEGSAA